MGYALITGASSGIGLEYAHQLGRAGWNLIIVSNRAEDNITIAKELSTKYNIVVEPLYADLTCPKAAEMLYSHVQRLGIEVDIVINNAGMLLFAKLTHTPAEQLEKIINLHCTTPAKLCRLFAADMAKRKRGHILIMSSITAWTPYPTISLYAATKSFLRSFAQSLWYELRGEGVSVTVVFPSAVDTSFYNLDYTMRHRLLRCGVMLPPESVARKALKAMFRGRRRCLPGIITKIEAAICWLLPAWVLLPIMKIPAVKKILDRL